MCAVRTCKYGALFPLHPRIWLSLPLCPGCCSSNTRFWILGEMTQFTETVGIISHIFCGEVEPDPEVDFRLALKREWRSVLRRCFSLQFLFFAQLALGILDITSTSLPSLAVCDGGCFFALFYSIFRTPSSWTSSPGFLRSFWSPRWPTVVGRRGPLVN